MRRADAVFLMGAATAFAVASAGPDPARVAAAAIHYEEVKTWPALPAGVQLGEAAGVAVDINGHVFVFHRPGRASTLQRPNRSKMRQCSRLTRTRGN